MMKNKLVLTFCLILGLLPTIFAQNQPFALEWQKCFGGTRVENIYSATPTSDGGYIFLGSSTSIDGDLLNTGNINIYTAYRFWVVKVSMSNTIEWQRFLGGNNTDRGSSIIQTSDGGFLAVGRTTSYDGDVVGSYNGLGAAFGDGWVVKLSPSGVIEWQKCLGGTGGDDIKSVAKTRDGGYIVAGITTSNDSFVSGNHGGTDAWVAKISALGRLEWQKCVGGSNYDIFSSIKQTKDGGYIAAGYTDSNNGDVIDNHGLSDAWVVKLSITGALEWQKCYGGSGPEAFKSVIQTSEAGYILTGNTNSYNGDVRDKHAFMDVWVVKISELGVLQWQSCLGGSGEETGNVILQLTDGSYLLSATTSSDDGQVTPHNFGANPSDDAWIVKLSKQGTLEWQKPLGGWHADRLFSSIG